MVFVRRQIFVLGRYLERGLRDSHTNTRSDFFVYDMAAGRWTQITDDTAALGGPGLIFDHQMCIDLQKRSIYVFGGQSLFPLQSGAGEAGERSGTGGMEKKFSGLYRYHVPDNSWQLLREDGAAAGPGSPPLRSRTGHSMLFNNADRKLYIFGGQRRRDEYLNDFFTFQVDSGEVEALCEGAGAGEAIPAVGYTQRATIDCKRGEIFVMTGLNKDKVMSLLAEVSNNDMICAGQGETVWGAASEQFLLGLRDLLRALVLHLQEREQRERLLESQAEG